jgi:hypothetical protein
MLPIALAGVALAWAAVFVVVLGVCAAAARSDRALMAARSPAAPSRLRLIA